MPTWAWIAIGVGAALAVASAVIVAGGIAVSRGSRSRRSEALRREFGPEYDRALEDTADRSEAENELGRRRAHREQLVIGPLDQDSYERYSQLWDRTQQGFVDDPEGAVMEADRLIRDVMRERGYPAEDFEQRAADLSVDFPTLTVRYRDARAVALSNERTTEDLRCALRDYRSVFDELLVVADGDWVRRGRAYAK
jgi:hypothetical protein